MRRFFVLSCLAWFALAAHAAEPSAASIDRLLEVTQSRQLSEAMLKQVGDMLRPSMAQAIGSRSMSAEQRRKVEDFSIVFSQKMMPILTQEMAWERVRETTQRIYRESFTQQEVDSLIALYESPGGQLLVTKMPLVAQKTMLSLQERIGPVLQRIQAAARESAEEFKARQAEQK